MPARYDCPECNRLRKTAAASMKYGQKIWFFLLVMARTLHLSGNKIRLTGRALRVVVVVRRNEEKAGALSLFDAFASNAHRHYRRATSPFDELQRNTSRVSPFFPPIGGPRYAWLTLANTDLTIQRSGVARELMPEHHFPRNSKVAV